ncbi:MAG: SHS2 domain-containing protein [Candidatus Nanohaloarchaea archaeon]|jgi:SHS2 domain-containing protein
MSYEILEHTADEKFRAEGETLNEAFSDAVKAFGEIVGSDPEAGEYQHEIEVESESHEALLFDFLDKLIFLQDTEGVAVCQTEELSIEEKEDSYLIKAVIWVDAIDEEDSFQDIKAPTYNEMNVDYEKGTGWVVEAVLDI